MNTDQIIALISVIFIAYYLIWEVDWDAVEKKQKKKWQHTFLNDKDFEKLQETLNEYK